MYNSRPRYNSFSSEFNVPENYSGNAFFEEEEIEDKKPESAEPEESKKEEKETEEALATSSLQPKKGLFSPRAGFGIDISRLFGGGIGFEELLILGLVLLMAEGEGNEDMIILLLLLLFIG